MRDNKIIFTDKNGWGIHVMRFLYTFKNNIGTKKMAFYTFME